MYLFSSLFFFFFFCIIIQLNRNIKVYAKCNEKKDVGDDILANGNETN